MISLGSTASHHRIHETIAYLTSISHLNGILVPNDRFLALDTVAHPPELGSAIPKHHGVWRELLDPPATYTRRVVGSSFGAEASGEGLCAMTSDASELTAMPL